jgi:hypothetical protein
MPTLQKYRSRLFAWSCCFLLIFFGHGLTISIVISVIAGRWSYVFCKRIVFFEISINEVYIDLQILHQKIIFLCLLERWPQRCWLMYWALVSKTGVLIKTLIVIKMYIFLLYIDLLIRGCFFLSRVFSTKCAQSVMAFVPQITLFLIIISTN